MSVVIHGVPLSPFTRKVLLLAREKEIDHELRNLNPYQAPDYFRRISPLKTIPVLEDGDYRLNDSSAICTYLDHAYSPDMRFLPSEPRQLGKVLWIEEYADTALFEPISEGVFRPIFINQLLGKPINFVAVKAAVADTLPTPLAYLESQIIGREWFVSDRMTLADLSVYAQLVNLKHAGQLPHKPAYPHLISHYERIESRPIGAALMQSEITYLQTALERLKQ